MSRRPHTRPKPTSLRSHMPKAAFRASYVSCAVRAARSAGLPVNAVGVTKEGTIRVLHSTRPLSLSRGTPPQLWEERLAGIKWARSK